jgi:16S rRNA (cytidine1402-2'-O)-methyltransferase
VLIEGNSISADETPSDDFLEHELKELMAEGHALSSVHIPLNSCLHL